MKRYLLGMLVFGTCGLAEVPTGGFRLGGGGSGSGPLSVATGTVDPNIAPVSCVAPSNSNFVLYYQSTAKEMWQCVDTNLWEKLLATANTGGVDITGATGSAPVSVAAGKVDCWYDTSKTRQMCMNPSLTVFATVKVMSAR